MSVGGREHDHNSKYQSFHDNNECDDDGHDLRPEAAPHVDVVLDRVDGPQRAAAAKISVYIFYYMQYIYIYN